jgi:Ankyrin repeats (3 copies)
MEEHNRDLGSAYVLLSRFVRQFINASPPIWANSKEDESPIFPESLNDEVNEWVTSICPRVIMVVGTPRTGKSFLVKAICTKPDKVNNVVLYFSFENLGLRQNASIITPSILLWQLATQMPYISRFLEREMKKWGCSVFFSSKILWKVLSTALSNIKRRTVCLAIDGFDHCAEEVKLETLNHITSLEMVLRASLDCQVKILLGIADPVPSKLPRIIVSAKEVLMGAQIQVANSALQAILSLPNDGMGLKNGRKTPEEMKLRRLAIISCVENDELDFLRPRLLLQWSLLQAKTHINEQQLSRKLMETVTVQMERGMDKNNEVLLREILSMWTNLSSALISIALFGAIPSQFLDHEHMGYLGYSRLLFTVIDDTVQVVHPFITKVAWEVHTEDTTSVQDWDTPFFDQFASILQQSISKLPNYCTSELSEIDSALHNYPELQFCAQVIPIVGVNSRLNRDSDIWNIIFRSFERHTVASKSWISSVLSYIPAMTIIPLEIPTLHALTIVGDIRLVSMKLCSMKNEGLKSNKDKDEFGRTALHYAAMLGQAAIFTLLINENFDICEYDNGGMNAFELACWEGNDKMVLMILDSLRSESEVPTLDIYTKKTTRATFLLNLALSTSRRLPMAMM